MRSEHIRLLIFSLFLALLIVFGMVYQPVDAVSHPADRANSAQIKNAQASPERNPVEQQKR